MAKVKVILHRQHILVEAPWVEGFPEAAHKIGGAWLADRTQWAFPIHNADLLRTALRTHYGTDGTDEGHGGVRIPLDQFSGARRIELFGYPIAHRYRSGYPVATGPETTLVEGSWPIGSVDDTLGNLQGVVVELAAIPLAVAQAITVRVSGAVVIDDTERWRFLLEEEKTRLLRRVDEINEELAE